jgi:tRNA 2-thiocytidine biosynthesis protein TtcA
VAYASPLEARIAKKATQAIVRFGMIEDGDRIMVGLSGGKDSWTLMQTLEILRQRAPIRFSLHAVNVDYGVQDESHAVLASTCAERGWDYRGEHTSISDSMREILDPDANPCSLCARFRRGVLYRVADEMGATKIALGHHADDFLETLLLNLWFAGSLKAMPARLLSDDGRHVVIRPLVYVSEDDCRAYAEASNLPVVRCPCPASGAVNARREEVKHILRQLEQSHSGVKRSMLRALENVRPGHLLDRKLYSPLGTGAGGSAARFVEAVPDGSNDSADRARKACWRTIE